MMSAWLLYMIVRNQHFRRIYDFAELARTPNSSFVYCFGTTPSWFIQGPSKSFLPLRALRTSAENAEKGFPLSAYKIFVTGTPGTCCHSSTAVLWRRGICLLVASEA